MLNDSDGSTVWMNVEFEIHLYHFFQRSCGTNKQNLYPHNYHYMTNYERNYNDVVCGNSSEYLALSRTLFYPYLIDAE